MTRDELAAIATRWISLWTAPVDWRLFAELHAEAFVDAASAGRPPTRDGFADGVRAMLAAFPDLATRVEDLVVDAATGRVAVRWRAEGTNRARYLGVGPTGRRTAITGIEIIEIAGGEIVRRWGEWDIGEHTGWIDAYLVRLGLAREDVGRDPASLARLHRAHLLAAPFENLSIHAGEAIQLDAGWLYDKIVRRRRGGFCYELNGLFAELLVALGFRVERLAAQVYGDGGALGIPFDHMCLRVDDVWLVDVGFGDSFIVPLRLDERGVQHDGRREFRIVDDGPDARILEDAGKPAFRFTLAPFALADFAPGCTYHTTSPASHFTRRSVVSRLTPDGRITLRDDRLITTAADGGKTETPIAGRTAWREAARARFDLDPP
jgi:N-hydroxyarylamine O-acetyltransferase